MCLIAFAIGTRPSLPLLLAANRDEHFNRPTQPLHRWPDRPGVWAGRDGRDGGTWLGLADNGRVALLTNVRSTHTGPGARSRGELATRWLCGEQTLERFIADLDPAAYAGFNLVVGDLHAGRWTWLCNRNPAAPHQGAATGLHRRELAPGVYGLSNAVLDTPWPKTRRLVAALRAALPDAPAPDTPAPASPATDWTRPLQAGLADDRPAPVHRQPATGVDAATEHVLSSPFVRWPGSGYGTRSSLILRVRRSAEQPATAGQTGVAGQSNRAGSHLPAKWHPELHAELHEWTHSPDGWCAHQHTHHTLSF